MDERTAFPTDRTNEGSGVPGPNRSGDGAEGGEGVDFASRRAARGKMQLWLTAFTAAAAVAILAVVSMSVLHPG